MTRLRWAGVGAAVVSVATMSLTAIWFLVLGPAVFAGSALARSETGGAIGVGMLAGPIVYLGLAFLT